jgi:hypothetical protein
MIVRRAEHLLRRLQNASEAEQWRIIRSMTPIDLAALDAWFEFWLTRTSCRQAMTRGGSG